MPLHTEEETWVPGASPDEERAEVVTQKEGTSSVEVESLRSDELVRNGECIIYYAWRGVRTHTFNITGV